MNKENLEVFLEDISSKLDQLLEGNKLFLSEIRVLCRKADERLYKGGLVINALNDAVATDLTAHRADTESHHGIYRVKES